ncbi:MAG: D-2-hydroxyacid dehydrogenase [Tissierellia bacterium]|nr:D-2-hydroxyacid dehydrogenase [Tissierellia bacterium]
MIGVFSNGKFLKLEDVRDYFSKNIDRDWKIYEDFDSLYKDRDKIEILVNSMGLGEDKIKDFKNLKWVFSYSAGVDSYPLEAFKDMKVKLTNVSGVHAKNISEQVLGVMIMFSRNLIQAMMNKEEKTYRKYETSELFGKSLLIVGMGAIGKELARRAKAFDMKIVGVRNHLDGKSHPYFDQIFVSSDLKDHIGSFDYIVSILPSTDKTRRIFDYKMFELMDEASIFINVGRGDAVVEEDLLKALEENKLKGAYLDVFNKEPLDEKSQLWDMDNVFITPHIAGTTPFYFERAMELFEKNLNEFENGEKMTNLISYEDKY